MKTREEIVILVEKFLDGKTTNQEEQMLYDWFSANDVSKEWQPLKEMFAWYADGMPEEQIELSEELQPQKRGVSLHRPRRVIRWISVGVSIAAMVAVVLIATLRPRQSEFNIYEGSYIVEAGVRNDDIASIESEIEAMLLRAEAIENHANELLAWADTI
ncbi:MAG: hypothetical protein IKJ20_02170 [Alistipes sp.]|nr:hypothetical protein [Alistipes sp.]